MGYRSISIIIILTISSLSFVDSGLDNHLIQNDFSSIDLPDDIVSNFQDTEKLSSISQNVVTKETSQAIETNSITSEVHSPGRDSYIVDFGFHQTYTYETSQVVYDSIIGLGYIRFNESAFFSVDLTIPVNITLHYSDIATAGEKTVILVDLFKVPGGASFSISYGFTLHGAYRIGWGSLKTFELLEYSNIYEILSFDIPMDPVPLTDLTFPLPIGLIPVVGPVISALFGIDLILTPQIDVDISADIFFEGLGEPSIDTINFKTEEQQSITIDVNSFSESDTGIKFGLTNFSMDFYLSLLWAMQLKLKGIFGFLGPWRINLFTYPRLPIGGLPTTGETYGLLDIQPTNNLPDFSIDSYYVDEGGNGILEPGESGTIYTDFINLGDGPAMNANVTVSSDNITINSGNSEDHYLSINQENSFSQEITFSISAGYLGRNITIHYDIDWLAANGSIRSQQEELLIRVLQPGDAFLSIDQWSTFEPIDGIWDAEETVRIDIDISKIGSADVVYAELELLGYYSSSTYTSNDTFDSITGSFSIWNSSGIFLTAPSDITENYLDIVVGIAYELSTGEVYFDYQIITLEVHPLSAKMELVDVFGILLDGEDDGIFMAGETFSISVVLENIGNYISSPIVGGFITDESDIIIQDILVDWDSIDYGFNDLSNNGVTLTINPRAENKTAIIYLVIAHETWYGDIVFDIFPFALDIVQQPDPEPVLNYYEVYDTDLAASDLKPGEVFLITVGVEVFNGPAYDSIGYLSSNNENIFIYNDTSYYGDLYPGDTISEGDGFIVSVPANFEGGTVRFYVNVTMYNGIGDLIYSLGYFDIIIEAGDTAIPTYTLDTTSIATEGESVTVTITASDNVGVDDIYFTYYDYETEDWIIELLDWTDTPTVSFTVTMGSETFLYAFIVFDVSGNYVGVGLETPLEINLPDTSSSTSTTSTTAIDMPTPTPSNEETSPVGMISILIAIFILPIVLRKLINIKFY